VSAAKEIGVALLGLGNVGQGTYRILDAHARDIERRLGAPVRVSRVLVRDGRRARDVPASLVSTDAAEVIGDPRVSIVVELMGGLEPARAYVMQAIAAGRHVVTANKALLAAHGEALFRGALDAGVDLHFEAAVCGGIPIIRTLRESLASDRVEALVGIVNGTTNFILSRMAEEGVGYAAALTDAQALGLAEADPALDVDGRDAAQKLCLLAQLAFGARLLVSQIHVEGIGMLAPLDFEMASQFGFALKLLALARTEGGRLDVRVHPAFVPTSCPLADVRGATNAVLVQSAALGTSLYSGQGAGALPTGSAVVSDIIDVARNLLAGVPGRLPMLCAPYLSDLPVRPIAERVGRAYLRFHVADAPGVLGRIATVLGEKRVSLASVLQPQPEPNASGAVIAVFTHSCREADLGAAVSWIDALPDTLAPTQMIRIEDRPPL
jgi:homoserine dehydrogenase